MTAAKLRLAADNQFVVYVNGRQMGTGNGWQQTVAVDLAPGLQPGDKRAGHRGHECDRQGKPRGIDRLLRDHARQWPNTCRHRLTKRGRPATARCRSGRPPTSMIATGTPRESWSRVVSGPWGELDGEHGLTLSPVASNPFVGRFSLPADWLADDLRVCVEADELAPEGAAAVTLNGHEVGGFIGKPYRLDITARVQPGENRLVLKPFAPRRVNIVVYPRAAVAGNRKD